MIKKRPWQEVITDFTAFVHEFEQLKKKHPQFIVEKAPIFTAEHKKKWPVLQEFPRNLMPYVERLVECLLEVTTGVDEPTKLKMLYWVFDNMNLFFTDPNFSMKESTEVMGSAQQSVFFKFSKYWKRYGRSPAAFSRSFQTFGRYSHEHPVSIINLDDVIDELSVKGTTLDVDQLQKGEHLDIGLFPLSKDYLRLFKVTRQLDQKGKIYGFIADKLNYAAFQGELDEVIKIIAENEIHIACFPELLINAEAREYLEKGIRALNKPFFILIAGSDHRADLEGSYKNSTPVLVYHGRKELEFTYSKQEAFGVELKETNKADVSAMMQNLLDFVPEHEQVGMYLREDMVPDTSLLLLASKKYGDIGFVICKDFLPDSSEIIHNYNKIADHLFIISLNFSKSADFKERGMHISREHGLAVFYVNARSFDPKFHSPSFYLTPGIQEPISISNSESWLTYRLMPREMPKGRGS